MNSFADTPKLRKAAPKSESPMARRCERESFEIPVCPRSGGNPDRRGDLRSGDGSFFDFVELRVSTRGLRFAAVMDA